MNKWIAEFELEDGDTMPEHMDLEYKGAKIDFHCRPKEPVLDKLRAEITTLQNRCYALTKGTMCAFCKYECEYKTEMEDV